MSVVHGADWSMICQAGPAGSSSTSSTIAAAAAAAGGTSSSNGLWAALLLTPMPALGDGTPDAANAAAAAVTPTATATAAAVAAAAGVAGGMMPSGVQQLSTVQASSGRRSPYDMYLSAPWWPGKCVDCGLAGATADSSGVYCGEAKQSTAEEGRLTRVL